MSFSRTLKAHSMAIVGKSDLEGSGKVLLPTSALEILARMEIAYPMIFRLFNARANKFTHAGVWEFTAEEGHVYMPYWMLQNLMLQEGQMVTITSATLPKAEFAKFQPQSTAFLDISNPKAVLENSLRMFTALTKGDVVRINYNQKTYDLSVLELRPAGAASIFETDVNVDFAPPIGYVEPKKETGVEIVGVETEPDPASSFSFASARNPTPDSKPETVLANAQFGYVPFSGAENRLKGRGKESEERRVERREEGRRVERRDVRGEKDDEKEDKWAKLGQGRSLR